MNTYVLPILTYGIETWQLNRTQNHNLQLTISLCRRLNNSEIMTVRQTNYLEKIKYTTNSILKACYTHVDPTIITERDKIKCPYCLMTYKENKSIKKHIKENTPITSEICHINVNK